MSFRFSRIASLCAIVTAAITPGAAASATYLFWMPPSFAGEPVRGDEPGVGLPMPGATEKELGAHLLWNMRAGLNVAALQCQFAPSLMVVKNYNTLLNQHDGELTAAYTTISGYFKRTGGKTWQKALDQYTTKTYNGFSTLHAQLGFCETAGAIGRAALFEPRGGLHTVAATRLREFRNSLVPSGDRLYAISPVALTPGAMPPLQADCWDRKNRLKPKCAA